MMRCLVLLNRNILKAMIDLKVMMNFILKSVEEMNKLFHDIPHAIENSVILARKCSFYLRERPPCLPKIKSNDIDENTLLKKDSISGLKKKIGKQQTIIKKIL